MSASTRSGQRHAPEADWRFRLPAPPSIVAEVVRELKIPPLLASALWSRGYTRPTANVLRPPLTPVAIPSLEPAAAKLEAALKTGQRILVHGDYDADGLCGAAILTMGLRALGGDANVFIPNRLGDGYGIHQDRVAEHAMRAEVLITVDCGISNAIEVASLAELGVEVIVTDHHQSAQPLPDCLVVHPKDAVDNGSGASLLTGSGVAYHVLWALHRQLGLKAPLEFADLAAIGTIADVAPLTGANRALVIEGLARLRETRWPGLRAMVTSNGLSGQEVTARHAAFVLAPRLNAAGRLGEAMFGFELLTTASARRARELAVYLDARNFERRKIQDAMLEQALQRADPAAPAIVLHDDAWHPGVMGIVASKVLERLYRPVYITAQGKGSVRSTPGISAIDSLAKNQDVLERFGGHEQAAGFAIRSDRVEVFAERIVQYASDFPRPRQVVLTDALIHSAEVDDELLTAIDRLEPYGEGHALPTFLFSGELDAARAVGKDGSTLQLKVSGLRGVAWQQGDLAADLGAGGCLDLAITLRENEWQGKTRLEFLAQSLRPARPLAHCDDRVEVVRRPTVNKGPPPGNVAAKITEAQPDGALGSRGGTRWVKELPIDCRPLDRVAAISALLTGSDAIYFDLQPASIQRVEEAAADLPTLRELRRAYVSLSRRQPLGMPKDKSELCETILRELDLADGHSVIAKPGKRDVYGSDTFLCALIERYALLGFVKAYRHLEGDAFDRTVKALFLDNSS